MRRAALLAAALVAGCGGGTKDVCDGIAGTCVTLHVTGAGVSQVDQLAIDISGGFTSGAKTTPATPHTESLPIDVPGTLPRGAAGAMVFHVIGLFGGGVVGEGRSAQVTITDGQHTVVAVTLVGSGGTDMAGFDGAPPDLLAPPDLTGVMPGVAQIAITDVTGTAYDKAGNSSPFAHVLFVQNSLPPFVVPAQYTDPDFSTAIGAIHGCIANRYDPSIGMPQPPDDDAGLVTLSGYETNLYAVSPSVPPAPGFYVPPIPGTLNCLRGAAPVYHCLYGNQSADMATSVEGSDVNTVAFPAIPAVAFGGTCPAPTVARVLSGTTYCEQFPFGNPASPQISETLAGNPSSTYGGVQVVLVPAPGVTVVSIDNGGTTVVVAANDPLAAISLDPTRDLTITWSCDGTPMEGSGCPTGAAAIPDVVGLAAIASATPRNNFVLGPQHGIATCVEQVGVTGTTTKSRVVLRSAAITTLLQGQPVGSGSIFLVLARLSASPASTMGHTVFFAAGRGDFAFLNR